MNTIASTESRAAFDRQLAALRPKLHRYCARMVGSVIDGEDVLQDAVVKAIEAFSETSRIDNPEGWLFRIAHNAALDFLRRRAQLSATFIHEDPEMVADLSNGADARQAAAASLRTFMALPVAQRSSVILMDVLGYSLDEISTVTDTTIPAVKAALHRGRQSLRELAARPDDTSLPVLAAADQARLAAYVERFNARDFDAVRDMLAGDVKLELVARLRLNGKSEVQNYFHNYDLNPTWQFTPAIVEGRPGALVHDPATAPYFVLLEWTTEGLIGIRDFRYATYVTEGVQLTLLG
jgi:RNA polymerase sigma-70 factor (ECF subfamily)